MTSGTSQVDKTTLSKEDDVPAVGHGESIDLGLNIDGLLGVSLEPCNINFNIEVTNAEKKKKKKHCERKMRSCEIRIRNVRWDIYLDTMASSGMTEK